MTWWQPRFTDLQTCAPETSTTWLKPSSETVGRTPLPLLPSHPLFLLLSLPLLHHSLPSSLYTSDAGVWEHAQSMERNPHEKTVQQGGRPTSEPRLQDPATPLSNQDEVWRVWPTLAPELTYSDKEGGRNLGEWEAEVLNIWSHVHVHTSMCVKVKGGEGY